MSKFKFFEIEQEEAEKEQTESILQFVEKIKNYLMLHNVRIISAEERKTE
jgi:hypothetical protein